METLWRVAWKEQDVCGAFCCLIYWFDFMIHLRYFHTINISTYGGCLIRSENYFPFVSSRVHPWFFGGARVAHRLRFLCYVFMFWLFSPCVLCAACCLCLLIVHSWLSLWFSLTFLYIKNHKINTKSNQYNNCLEQDATAHSSEWQGWDIQFCYLLYSILIYKTY